MSPYGASYPSFGMDAAAREVSFHFFRPSLGFRPVSCKGYTKAGSTRESKKNLRFGVYSLGFRFRGLEFARLGFWVLGFRVGFWGFRSCGLYCRSYVVFKKLASKLAIVARPVKLRQSWVGWILVLLFCLCDFLCCSGGWGLAVLWYPLQHNVSESGSGFLIFIITKTHL